MTQEQYLKNLQVPAKGFDVILDTDAYNEIDDQFAISYLLAHKNECNIIGFTAAPFLNGRSKSPAEGMEKSYLEIKKLLTIAKETSFLDKVYRGSPQFMQDEKTPVMTEAATFIAETAKKYSPEKPLYVVAIGAITNVASALLLAPEAAENMVILWLGGHVHDFYDTTEFNMVQDIAASRVVMASAAPFVQFPCYGVVSELRASKADLEYWLRGKNALCDYLIDAAIAEADGYAKGKPWTRVIWDVAPVCWLFDSEKRFFGADVQGKLVPCERVMKVKLSGYDGKYEKEPIDKWMNYVYFVNRDNIICDLFNQLVQKF